MLIKHTSMKIFAIFMKNFVLYVGFLSEKRFTKQINAQTAHTAVRIIKKIK